MGSNALVFGGLTLGNTSDAGASNDLYQLKLGSGHMEWSKIQVKGSLPLPRWKHTSTLYDNTQIIVIGGFHTSNHRLSDVWIYDVVTSMWKQPNTEHNNESKIACQLNFAAWQNAPSPRGGHTSTLIGDVVYLFGGYGGLGYSRRDLDDLFALNCKTWSWTRITAKGSPPEVRRFLHL